MNENHHPAESEKETIVEFKNVSKSYESQLILKDLNFKIFNGEFLSIVGPSGCGKTTILRLMKGLIKPDAGEIFYNEEIIGCTQDIGIVFQGVNLLPWRSVTENIQLPLELRRKKIADHKDRIADIISIVGLNDSEHKYPNQLSGGMKQLAALAKLMADDDKIILLDEPFASLDPGIRERMAKKLHQLWRETKSTIVFVTHYIDEAVYLSDRILVLSSKPSGISSIHDVSKHNGGTFNAFKFSVSDEIKKSMVQDDSKQHDERTLTDKTNSFKYKFTSKIKSRSSYLLSALLIFVLLFIWKGILSVSHYPEFILPAPETVALRFLESIRVNQLFMHAGVTYIESMAGFILGSFVGMLSGYMLAKVPFLERMLYPYITASQTTPIVAIAPLIALWFGFGMLSKIFISALIVLFPVLITTITAVREVSREMGEMMKGLGATRLQTILHLEIPGSLPYLFSTMKVAITLSLVGAVVGEFVSSNRGLGYLIIASKGVLDTPLLFVTIIALAIVGFILYTSIIILEKVFFKSKTKYMHTKST